METRSNFKNLDALTEIATKSADAILVVDVVAKKVAFANEAATELFSVKTDDDFKKLKSLIDSVVTSDREYIRNKYRQLRENPAISNVEFRLLHSSGKCIWLTCDTFPINNAELVYAIIRNITKSKEHENYLVEFGARKNTLLDTLIHQLNGSLGLMNNLASRASQLTVTSDQSALETFVSLIQNNSRHCIRIIDDLVREEHAESPGIDTKLSRVDIVKVVNYIFKELQKSEDNRRFVFETNAPSILVNTDDFKLLQIVNNLTSNALKFTRPSDEIRVSLEDTSCSVIVSVSDTGIGIPDSLQPFLFEKHGPARRTGLNGEKSVGLGLSICNHLTKLLGGRLWFESKEGKGSSFYLELPRD